ncbi:hypothetical protein LCGC14_2662160, partial [marine sediment metagenome]
NMLNTINTYTFFLNISGFPFGINFKDGNNTAGSEGFDNYSLIDTILTTAELDPSGGIMAKNTSEAVYFYDDFEDASLNQSLWTNTSTITTSAYHISVVESGGNMVLSANKLDNVGGTHTSISQSDALIRFQSDVINFTIDESFTWSESSVRNVGGDANVTFGGTEIWNLTVLNDASVGGQYFGDGSQLTGISTFNATYDAKADYQFLNNNFNGSGNISLKFGDLVSEQNPDGADAIRIKATASDVDVVIGDMWGYFNIWNVVDDTAVFFVNERGDTDIAGDLDIGGDILLNDGDLITTGSVTADRFFGNLANEVDPIHDLTLDDGLISWWRMDDITGTTVTDLGSSGDDGTLIEQAAQTEGVIGKAVTFDGAGDYIDLGNYTATDGLQNLSVSLWFKTDEIPASGLRPILGIGPPGSRIPWIFFPNGASAVRVQMSIIAPGVAQVDT